MKSKITDYVNRIEKLFEEVKTRSKEAEDVFVLVKQSEGDLQNSYLMEHFILTNYAGLIYQDVTRTIDRLVECYLNALEAKEELNFTEEEQKIIDKYLTQSQFLFHIEKGKVVPKQADLLDIMKAKSEGIKHEEFLTQYKKAVIK
jgi:hypothetical protein